MYLNHCIAEVFIHFIDVGIVRGYYDVILGSTYLTVHILGPGLKGAGAPNDNFRKNICSEEDLRSRIFGTFVVKFLACLPLLGFSNI